MNIIDLSPLPPPDIVEALDFEQIYQDVLADFRALMGDGWTAPLESDPVVKLLQVAAYRELQIRARINDAARSSLLAFATGASLDHAAAFYNVGRMEGEGDDRLRLRTQLRIASMSGNGTAEQYRYVAMSASADVLDAATMASAPGTVALAIWPAATANALETLAVVRAAFDSDDAKPLGVPLSVALARARIMDVEAVVYRERTAPVDVAAQLQAALPAQLAAHARLGRGVSQSWLMARLQVDGVSKVTLASDGVAVAPNEYIVAGVVVVRDGGVAW